MSKDKTIEITEENVRNVYDNGCDDVKKVLRRLFPKTLVASCSTAKVGDYFKIESEMYILARTNRGQIALIGLTEDIGNRWNDPVNVRDCCNITVDDMRKVYDGGGEMQKIPRSEVLK